jgi:hypothetical protein
LIELNWLNLPVDNPSVYDESPDFRRKSPCQEH